MKPSFCMMKVHVGLYAAHIAQFLILASVFAYPSLRSSIRHLDARETMWHIDAEIKGSAEVSALAPQITKRDWRNQLNLFAHTVRIGGQWVLQYNALDLIRSPLGPAFSELVHFYNDVLFIAGDEWANGPASLYRAASFGSLRLVFQSNQPIAWLWIQSFLTGAVCPYCFRFGFRF